jgi:hypothetical protein
VIYCNASVLAFSLPLVIITETVMFVPVSGEFLVWFGDLLVMGLRQTAVEGKSTARRTTCDLRESFGWLLGCPAVTFGPTTVNLLTGG